MPRFLLVQNVKKLLLMNLLDKGELIMISLVYNLISTAVAELERVIKVFAERLKLESPFTDAATICIRAFLLPRSVTANILDFDSSVLGSIPSEASKMYSFKRSFLYSLRVDKRISVPKIQSRVFKGRTGRNAKHSISGISERKGDNLTGSIPDHAVVAHSKNNKQYRINDFLSTCLNNDYFKGLVVGAYHP